MTVVKVRCYRSNDWRPVINQDHLLRFRAFQTRIPRERCIITPPFRNDCSCTTALNGLHDEMLGIPRPSQFSAPITTVLCHDGFTTRPDYFPVTWPDFMARHLPPALGGRAHDSTYVSVTYVGLVQACFFYKCPRRLHRGVPECVLHPISEWSFACFCVNLSVCMSLCVVFFVWVCARFFLSSSAALSELR